VGGKPVDNLTCLLRKQGIEEFSACPVRILRIRMTGD